jgi:hypothetical protein
VCRFELQLAGCGGSVVSASNACIRMAAFAQDMFTAHCNTSAAPCPTHTTSLHVDLRTHPNCADTDLRNGETCRSAILGHAGHGGACQPSTQYWLQPDARPSQAPGLPQGRLGGGEGVQGIYGSITQQGMQRVLDCLHHSCGLGPSSTLVDIGAGLGR